MRDKIEIASRYSKCGELRLQATWHACEHTDMQHVQGDFVECGVWKGGNVMIARWVSPRRQCWLYDTFVGMTLPSKHDRNRKGVIADPKRWFGKSAVDVHDVRRNLAEVGVYDADRIRFVIGDVCKTLNVSLNLPDKIAVLRLDTDFYESTKIEMEVLYPRLEIGGYLIIDDYGHWLGARQAVDEYLGARSNKLTMIDETGAWMIKEQ